MGEEYSSIREEVPRYAVVGAMNTFVNLVVFNMLMLVTGITQGALVPVFVLTSFAVTIIHAFFWNKFWVFNDRNGPVRKQLATFTLVATATALITTGVIHFLVNVVGAPQGIVPVVWANLVVVGIIPLTFLLNFFGTKLLVFTEKDRAPLSDSTISGV